MYLVQIGYLTVSLEHLILAEDGELEPDPRSLPEGVLRITLEAGRVLDLRGELAGLARRLIREAVKPDRTRGPSRRPTPGRAVVPKPDRVVPPKPAEGVEGG